MRPDYLSKSRNRLLPSVTVRGTPVGGGAVGAAPNAAQVASALEVGTVGALMGLLGGMFFDSPLAVTVGSGALVSLAFGAGDVMSIGSAFGGSYLGARLSK